MTLIMELIFAAGVTISVDVTQMYGINDMDACQQMITPVVQSYKAIGGICYTGNMLSAPASA